jgi:hypothetical protein
LLAEIIEISHRALIASLDIVRVELFGVDNSLGPSARFVESRSVEGPKALPLLLQLIAAYLGLLSKEWKCRFELGD